VLQRPQQQSAGVSACRGVSLQNLKPCVSLPQRGPRTAGGTKSVSGTIIATNRRVMAGGFVGQYCGAVGLQSDRAETQLFT